MSSTSVYNSLVAFAKANKTNPLKVAKTLLAWEATSYSPFGAADPAAGAYNSDANIVFGSCGWRATLMQDVLKAAGIESRKISLYNIPIQVGHVAIEVKVAGNWVFMDPTTGVYFEGAGGKALGLNEVRNLWPNGQATAKISVLPAMTGVAADIWSTPATFNTLIDPFLKHPGYPGRDDVVNLEVFSAYLGARAETFGRTERFTNGANKVVLVGDPKDAYAWNLTDRHFDAKGRADFTTVRYDNEGRHSSVYDFKFIDYDQSGFASWATKTVYLEETYFVRYRSIEWRDGTRTVESFDHASADWMTDQAWQTHTFTHYTRGKIDSSITITKDEDVRFIQGGVSAIYDHAADKWSANLPIVRSANNVIGTAAAEVLIGEGADNTYYVSAGDVVLEQRWSGRDTVNAYSDFALGQNVEALYLVGDAIAGYGNDLSNTIVGNDRNNNLFGGVGADWIYGGAGNDKLNGGLDRDVLTGGAGADVFVFNNLQEAGKGGGRDSILDFRRGADKIDLSSIDANTIRAGNGAFHWIGEDVFSDTAGELHYRRVASGVLVEGDVNGDGRSDFEIFIQSIAALRAFDFVL